MLRLLLLPLLCGLLITRSFGEIITPAPGAGPFTWTRGDANTFYSGWNNFGEAFSEFTSSNTPEFTSPTNPGPVNLQVLGDGAGVTSTFNVYNATGNTPLSFAAQIPSFDLGQAYQTNVVVQFRTRGGGLNLTSLQLDGLAPTLGFETGRSVVGLPPTGQQGAPTSITVVDYLAAWSLSQTSPTHQLRFTTGGTNISLDQIHIDGAVTAVPEPATLALLGVAASAAGWSWRRKKLGATNC